MSDGRASRPTLNDAPTPGALRPQGDGGDVGLRACSAPAEPTPPSGSRHAQACNGAGRALRGSTADALAGLGCSCCTGGEEGAADADTGRRPGTALASPPLTCSCHATSEAGRAAAALGGSDATPRSASGCDAATRRRRLRRATATTATPASARPPSPAPNASGSAWLAAQEGCCAAGASPPAPGGGAGAGASAAGEGAGGASSAAGLPATARSSTEPSCAMGA